MIHHNSIPKDIKYKTWKKGVKIRPSKRDKWREKRQRKTFILRHILSADTLTANLHWKFYHLKKVPKLYFCFKKST